MHHITLPDGSTRQSRSIYAMRAFGYAAIAASSILIVQSPTLVGPLDLLWPIFLGFGGLSAMLGSMTMRWAGEFIGLPLIGAGLGTLAVISYNIEIDQAPWLARANLALLLGFAAMITIRWRAVLAVYRIAVRFPKKRRGHHDD